MAFAFFGCIFCVMSAGLAAAAWSFTLVIMNRHAVCGFSCRSISSICIFIPPLHTTLSLRPPMRKRRRRNKRGRAFRREAAASAIFISHNIHYV